MKNNLRECIFPKYGRSRIEMNDEFELLREQNPEAYRELLDSLPDVRDGLNRRQRALLVSMNRLGLTHDARTMCTAYVTLKTPDRCESKSFPFLSTHLKEVRFSDGQGKDLPEPETYYTPDLDLKYD